MALFAGDVTIPNDLTQTMSGIGTNATNAIKSNYSRLKGRQQAESTVRGMPVNGNSYAPERMGVQQGLDIGALGSSLSGSLGDTAYKDTLAQREYGQNLDLADQIASLNKPSTLQEIFSGIGSVGKTGAAYYGMKGRGGKSTKSSDEDSEDSEDSD